MIRKWQIRPEPSPRDSLRHRLDLNADRPDLNQFIRKMGMRCSRPRPSVAEGFDYSLYLYGLDAAGVQRIQAMLNAWGASYAVAPAPARIPAAVSTPVPAAVVTSPSIAPPEPEPLKPAVSCVPPQPISDPNYTFEQFVVGANNRFTHAAAMAVSDNPGSVYNPLLLLGASGMGKTHLMQAIGQSILRHSSRAKIVFFSGLQLSEFALQAGQSPQKEVWRDWLRQIQGLLIDNIHLVRLREENRSELSALLNACYETGKQVVATSHLSPPALLGLQEQLRFRFDWGLTVEVKPPSPEVRLAIVKRITQRLRLDLEPDTFPFLVSKLPENLKYAQWCLKRLQVYLKIKGLPGTVADLESALSLLLHLPKTQASPEIFLGTAASRSGRVFFLHGPSLEKEVERFCRHFEAVAQRHGLTFSLPAGPKKAYDPKRFPDPFYLHEMWKATGGAHLVILYAQEELTQRSWAQAQEGHAAALDFQKDWRYYFSALMEAEGCSGYLVEAQDLASETAALNLALDLYPTS